MIKPGEHPKEDLPGAARTNEFVGFQGGDQRGKLVALDLQGRRGIFVALTESSSPGDGNEFGGIYLAEEVNPNQWPAAREKVGQIPEAREGGPSCSESRGSNPVSTI